MSFYCINRNILTIISEKYFRNETNRLHNTTLPEIYDHGLRVGAVDFTQTGYKLFREILLYIFGIKHLIEILQADRKISGQS